MPSFIFAQQPTWMWADKPEGEAFCHAMDTDAAGNVYIAGFFTSNTITFGSFTLTGPGSNGRLFLVKYDPEGNVIWAKSADGCIYSNLISSIAVDDDGFIYAAGSFNYDDITFGSVTLINSGSSDVFLVKFDPDGNAIWAKDTGGHNFASATSVKVNSSGDVYIAGSYSGNSITFGSVSLGGSENGFDAYDIFLARYDSSGNVIWVKRAGGGASEYASAMCMDDSDRIYVSGEFASSSFTFGSTTLIKSGIPGYYSTDVFLVAYDNSGNELWAKSAGGTLNEEIRSMALDTQNDCLYLVGNYKSDSLTFGSYVLKNAEPQVEDIFLVKYNLSGDVIWAKSAGGTKKDIGNAVDLDYYGNTYMTGVTESSLFSFGALSLPTPGPYQMFVVKHDTYGNPVWIKSTNNSGSVGQRITVDRSGYPYVSGRTGGRELQFDDITLTYPAGKFGFFTAKLSNPVATQIHKVICNGDSVLFNGNYVHTTGVFYDTLTGVNGADSLVLLSLNVIMVDTTRLKGSICEESFYEFYGTQLTESGHYFHELTSVNGCDSIVSLQLTVNPKYTIENPQTICQGETYSINGKTYTLTGNYRDTLYTVSGCDSIVLTQLQVYPAWQNYEEQTICRGNFFMFRGNALTDPGVYTDSFQTIYGCDSIFRLVLSVTPPDTVYQSEKICQGNSYDFYGTLLTTSGTYFHIYNSSTGCDSVNKMTFTVNPAPVADAGADIRIPHGSSVQLGATGGESYEWTPSTYLDDPYISNPISTPFDDITYSVRIIDHNDCISQDEINIFVGESSIYFPNAFTPNDDGINDIFRPKANDGCIFRMSIYNRWGQLLFTTDNIDIGWTGNAGSTQCPTGLYVYMATFMFPEEGETKTTYGTFTLIR